MVSHSHVWLWKCKSCLTCKLSEGYFFWMSATRCDVTVRQLSLMLEVTSRRACLPLCQCMWEKKIVNQFHGCGINFLPFLLSPPLLSRTDKQVFPCCLQKSVLKAEVVDWIVVGSESSLCDNYTVYCLSWGDGLICSVRVALTAWCTIHLILQEEKTNFGQQMDCSGVNSETVLIPLAKLYQKAFRSSSRRS